MRRLLPLIILAVSSFAAEPSGTILILPFFNESGLSNLDWIGMSISQNTRESLGARGLLVLPLEDRQEAYRRLSIRGNARLTHASVIKVAEELDATEVIYGRFRFTPQGENAPAGRGMLNVTAYTLNMRRMRKGPEFMESGPLENLATIESHIAWQALRYLAPESAPSEEEFRKEQPAVRLDALENYIRGLLAPEPELKHRFFTQAARLDERFSQPNFELGRLYLEKKEYRLAADWFAKVRPGAPRFTEANFLLGLCRYNTGNYQAAQQAFQAVAASVPLNEVFNNLGAAESKLNRPEALENFRRALEGDPADPDYHFNVGYALWKRGDFEKAAQSFRAVLDRNPEDSQATMMLGRCLKRMGPKAGDAGSSVAERLKLNYEEDAWRQLKAALEPAKSKQDSPPTR